ncbi:hypothetical protein NP233_g9263 [Leucocoprinus birnbaumii]|uniref:Uncharacterized protein n=1 Tax=Leucocoprinus birnbaumii TaxID=56174 RepID=A0AAD5YR09_9AGAR|nr:hypothetical protein NP233_g9263 [Leucocoprinus birnbaumii]
MTLASAAEMSVGEAGARPEDGPQAQSDDPIHQQLSLDVPICLLRFARVEALVHYVKQKTTALLREDHHLWELVLLLREALPPVLLQQKQPLMAVVLI